MNTLTIFDLDETLIGTDSELTWCRYLVDQQLISSESLQVMENFLVEYHRGQLDFSEYIRVSVQQWLHLDEAALSHHLKQYSQHLVSRFLYPQAQKLISGLVENKQPMLVITASNEVIGREVCRQLGINHVIATKLKQVEGQWTGEIEGIPSFSSGKVTRLKQWLSDQPHEFDRWHFYSDSINDVPLLKASHRSTVVNPCSELASLAQKHQWDIVHWAL